MADLEFTFIFFENTTVIKSKAPAEERDIERTETNWSGTKKTKQAKSLK